VFVIPGLFSGMIFYKFSKAFYSLTLKIDNHEHNK
jgi:hypothetical protein